jgi:cell division septation protein DedD
MDDDFNPELLRPAAYRPDTEVTLGPLLLLVLFFALVLLCGLCFGFGYSMGSRNTKSISPSAQQPGTQVPTAAALPKPAAIPQSPPADTQPATPHFGTDAAAIAPSPAAPVASSSQPIVKPALPTAPAPAAAPASTTPLATGPLMVQIATVSRQDDAEVLVGALRKLGYAVTVRLDPSDSQFHVRIGPFTNRNDANAMRRKLIGDGYNAIVQ